MIDKRPVNLHVTSWFPVPAVVSILHRVSGVALYAGTAVLLWALAASLESEESFIALQDVLSSPIWKLVWWATLAALIYHLVAGVRHLIMDFGIGEELKSGRLSAQLVIIVAVVLIALAGVWIW